MTEKPFKPHISYSNKRRMPWLWLCGELFGRTRAEAYRMWIMSKQLNDLLANIDRPPLN